MTSITQRLAGVSFLREGVASFDWRTVADDFQTRSLLELEVLKKQKTQQKSTSLANAISISQADYERCYSVMSPEDRARFLTKLAVVEFDRCVRSAPCETYSPRHVVFTPAFEKTLLSAHEAAFRALFNTQSLEKEKYRAEASVEISDAIIENYESKLSYPRCRGLTPHEIGLIVIENYIRQFYSQETSDFKSLEVSDKSELTSYLQSDIVQQNHKGLFTPKQAWFAVHQLTAGQSHYHLFIERTRPEGISSWDFVDLPATAIGFDVESAYRESLKNRSTLWQLLPFSMNFIQPKAIKMLDPELLPIAV